MKKRIIILGLLFAISLVILTGCIPGGGANTPSDPAGIFWGIWHGWIAPVSLVFSFFNDHNSIYEVYNTGFTYNLGFYIAVISGFGGLSLFRGKKKD